MIKVHLPFQCNSCSCTIPGLSIHVQAFWYPRLWLLLVARTQDGVGDMGIAHMANVMGVDHFFAPKIPLLHKTSKSMSISSSTTPYRGLNSAQERYLRWLERFPKIEEIMVSKIF